MAHCASHGETRLRATTNGGGLDHMANTPDKIVYTATATNTGGRTGKGTSEDPTLELTFTSPKDMGGSGEGTNPEQLFALGYGACFTGALGLAGKEKDVDVSAATVRTKVGFGPEGESFALTVDHEVHIPGLGIDEAQTIVDRTHELCPYSKATRGNVPVTVTAVESL